MAGKRKKQRQRHPSSSGQLGLHQQGSGEAQVRPVPTGKRRLPRPAPPAFDLPATAGISPAALTIAGYAKQAAAAQSLSPYTVMVDWISMIEATLARWAINQQSIMLTGTFTPDPPEVAAIFSRVRQRRDAAAQHTPNVARLLEQSWLHTFALLVEAAQADLWDFYAGQPSSPDVIGQAFWAAVDFDAAWAAHFPAWTAALTTVQALLPDGYELAYRRLASAARAARQDGQQLAAEPPVDQAAFETWYTVIEPYLTPLVIGPPLTDTSALTLATAAQFPPFLIKRGKILFQWPTAQPLLRQMQHINAMLYRLNGYLMEHLTTMTATEQELRQQQQAASTPLALPPTPSPALVWQQMEERSAVVESGDEWAD